MSFFNGESLAAVILIAVGRFFWLRLSKSRHSTSDWWRWYNAYLRSPEWKVKREGVLLRSRGRCEKCDHRKPIQVHHLTYERVGNELPEDLAAICFDCHRPIHPGKWSLGISSKGMGKG